MVNNYYNRLQKKRGTEFYGGRSPLNEILYGFDTDIPEGQGTPRLEQSFMQGYYRPNPNFSALNLSPVERRNIIDQSYLRNNLPVPNRGYSALGSQMNAMNLPMPSGSGQSGSGQKKVADNTPPNYKNNLLNYLVSPRGKGMAQGLLEASGYSETPIGFGQALAMGMKRSNEAQAQAQASQLAIDKFNYQKEIILVE